MSIDRGRDLPNTRLRRLLLALEGVVGHGGLITMLRQARLIRYTGELPPYNRELRLQAAEYAALVQAVEVYFGRGARGILLRVGRGAFEQLIKHQPLNVAGHRLVFLGLPRPARARRILRWLAAEIAAPHGRVEVSHAGGRFVVLDYEGDSVFGRRREAPGCSLTIGQIQAALGWATGREYEVVETECKGLGAPACRFEASEVTA